MQCMAQVARRKDGRLSGSPKCSTARPRAHHREQHEPEFAELSVRRQASYTCAISWIWGRRGPA
jgi:hypothetical protein